VPARRTRFRARAAALPAAVLAALAVAAYLPALGAGFIWDDDVYITGNPHLTSLSGLATIWLRPSSNMQYYPLTFTTLWVERQLWGLDPAGYHAVNVALHAACAVLLWLLLRALRLPGPLLAAAVFAVHPVLVESVAWCAELKNVQSAALSLLSLLLYFRAFPPGDGPPPPERRRRRDFALALLAFAGSLLTKPAAVALPLVIVLVAWWKRGRVTAADLLRVAPMLLMSVAMGVMTIVAEREYSGAEGAEWRSTPLARALVAGRALAFYAGKLAWPHPLMSVYPRWAVDTGAWWQYLFPLSAAAAIATLWALRGRLGRGPLTAALAYVLLLAPALGFVDIAYQQYSFVADHFQYHAAPAPIALAAAALAGVHARARRRASAVALAATGTLLLAVLGTLTWRHAGTFRSEATRCADTVAKNPGAWVAMENLAMELAAAGRHRDAIAMYGRALAARPQYADALVNRGVSLAAIGDLPAAARDYREALRLGAESAEAHSNLGRILAVEGDLDGAAEHFRAALRIRPRFAAARLSLGQTLLRRGRVDEAVAELERAAADSPADPGIRRALAQALARQRAGAPPPR